MGWFKKELKDCDMIISWFGSGFDLPYILSRAVINKVDLSEILKIPSFDLYKFCREHLSLAKYSLAEVARSFGIPKNTEISWKDMLTLYIKATSGNKKAKEEIIEHCRDDLTALKEIFHRLEKYLGIATR